MPKGRPRIFREPIRITLDPEAYAELDRAAKAAGISRSRYVELLIMAQAGRSEAFRPASAVELRWAAEAVPPNPHKHV